MKGNLISSRFTFILLAACFFSMGQLPLVAQKLDFERLSSEFGLSQNMINYLFQDKKGFLWVGTKDGLNRFDGYQFTVFRYDPFDSLSISGNQVWSILEDHQGRMWVATDQGINLFDREKEVFYNLKIRSSSWRMHEDPEGNIWQGGGKEGLLKMTLPPDARTLENVKVEWIRPTPGKVEMFSTPVWDAAGRCFTGKVGGAFYRMHFDSLRNTVRFDQNFDDLPDAELRELFEKSDSAAHNFINQVEQGRAGKIWVSSWQKLLGWDARKGQTMRFDLPPDIFGDNSGLRKWGPFAEVIEDGRDRLWLGGLGGSYCMDLKNRKLVCFSPKQTETTDPLFYGLNTLLEDQSGLIWLGTRGNGLLKFNDNARRFAAPDNAPGLWQGQSIRAIFKTSDGRVLLAPVGGKNGLFWLNPKTQKMTTFYSNVLFYNKDIGELRCFFEDKNGALWLGSENWGLVKVTNWQNGQPKFEPSIPETAQSWRGHSSPTKIIEDAAQNLWVVSPDALRHFDPRTKQTETFSFFANDFEKHERNPFPTLFQDRHGRLWVGTSEGLWRFDAYKKTFVKFQNNRNDPGSLSHDLIKSIAEDPMQPERFLWIGTGGGGLNRFDMETGLFEQFTEKDGLPDLVIYGILPDEAGNLWLSTNKGISVLNIKKRTFRNFDQRDGLQDLEFNTLAYHKSADGQLFFGGIKGFNAFYPARMLQSNSHIPGIVFTDFKISNHSVSIKTPDAPLKTSIAYTKKIVLPHDVKVFSFEFAALDFADPLKNQFACKMEGFDKEWRLLGNVHTATYTNLGPGKYIFRVRGSNNDGVWNEAGASIEIEILPPWWATWWAYSIYALTIGGVAFAFFRLQVKRNQSKSEAIRQRDLNEMKSRLYANVTHEFRTPLTLIIGLATRNLQNKTADIHAETRGAFQSVLNNGQRLLNLVNQMLDLRQLEAENLQVVWVQGDVIVFLRYLTGLFSAMAENSKVQLHFDADAPALLMDFDQDKWTKIMSNLLSNAFKFTPAGGRVYVEIQALNKKGEAAEALIIRVKDTGIGIDSTHLPHIFDRFYQVDNSLTRRKEGAGIGLALTKELVGLLGGNIRVESVPQAGTCFTLTLPIHQEAEVIGNKTEADDFGAFAIPVEVEKMSKEIEKVPRKKSANPRILIIEDNTELAGFIASSLEKKYQIHVAENGQIGIDKALAVMPDLIISDVMMPEKDGFEVCDFLKNDPRTSYIPIILLTAKASVEDRVAGLRRGVDAYLSKPFHEAVLLATIENLLTARRQLQSYFSKVALENKSETSLPPDPQNAPEEVFLQNLRAFILEKMSDTSLSLDDLCRAAGMGKSNLHAKLTALTGMSPMIFLRALRLSQAHALLLEGGKNVSEVAFEVGFDDPKYFSRVFSEKFGKPPSAFLKQR